MIDLNYLQEKMPKVKGRNHLKLDDIVQEFGSDIFVINSGKISCKLCKIDIQVKKKAMRCKTLQFQQTQRIY